MINFIDALVSILTLQNTLIMVNMKDESNRMLPLTAVTSADHAGGACVVHRCFEKRCYASEKKRINSKTKRTTLSTSPTTKKCWRPLSADMRRRWRNSIFLPTREGRTCLRSDGRRPGVSSGSSISSMRRTAPARSDTGSLGRKGLAFPCPDGCEKNRDRRNCVFSAFRMKVRTKRKTRQRSYDDR